MMPINLFTVNENNERGLCFLMYVPTADYHTQSELNWSITSQLEKRLPNKTQYRIVLCQPNGPSQCSLQWQDY